jgi:hypothetical protein
VNPRISAHRISQVIAKEIVSAWMIGSSTAPTYPSHPLGPPPR